MIPDKVRSIDEEKNSNETLHKKIKFFIKDFFSKCDQIRRKPQIKSLYWRNPQWKASFFVRWNINICLFSTSISAEAATENVL